jgi:hypothetical protein
MHALRRIIDVKDDQVIIKLPQNFQQQKVEVIILLDIGENRSIPEELQADKKVDYEQYFGVTNIGEVAIERELQSLRDEWERTCI